MGYAELSALFFGRVSSTDGSSATGVMNGTGTTSSTDPSNPAFLLRGSSSGSSGPGTSQGSQAMLVSGLPGSPGAPATLDPNGIGAFGSGRSAVRKYFLQVSNILSSYLSPS
ncbi:unnamed protein product [Echinostoma caproni]|uniref:Uncharacterized protein n=1 Tax=Echinostoma caproni TaxID=27848 RepID=A0A183BCM5_9TREM|nr:unnamed protein product [Echinostoma caproni]